MDSVPLGNYYSQFDQFQLNQIEWISKLFPNTMLRNAIAKVYGITKYTQIPLIYRKNELCSLMWIGEATFIPEHHGIKVVLLLGEFDSVGKVPQYCKSRLIEQDTCH